jgi:hypothetical protein
MFFLFHTLSHAHTLVSSHGLIWIISKEKILKLPSSFPLEFNSSIFVSYLRISSLCLFVFLSICLFVSLSLRFSVSLFLCFSVSLSLCLSVSLFLCFSVSPYLCFSDLCFSVSLSLLSYLIVFDIFLIETRCLFLFLGTAISFLSQENPYL